MRNERETARKDDFIAPTRRALRRAARKVREENRPPALPALPLFQAISRKVFTTGRSRRSSKL